MTLQFDELTIPEYLAMDHYRRGGVSLRRFIAHLPDGVLRLMVGMEPVVGLGMQWHLSVSHAVNDLGGQSPDRRPTDAECLAATLHCARLNPWVEDKTTSRVRHFWAASK